MIMMVNEQKEIREGNHSIIVYLIAADLKAPNLHECIDDLAT